MILNIKINKQQQERDTSNNDLSKVYVQEFDGDDDYHMDIDTSDPIVRNARNIRRRYNNIFEYTEAKFKLADYIHMLEDQYGGKEHFRMMLDAGLVTSYLPPIPKLKGSHTMQALAASGMMISIRPGRINIKEEQADAIFDMIDEMAKENEGEKLLFAEGSDARYHELMEELQSNKRTARILKGENTSTVRNLRTSEDLSAYFSSRDNPMNSSLPGLNIPASFIADKEALDRMVDGGSGTRLRTNELTGTLMTRETADSFDLLGMMTSLGWNSIEASRLINDDTVSTTIHTEKDKMKMLAKQKEVSNQYINSLLEGNGISADLVGRGMLGGTVY